MGLTIHYSFHSSCHTYQAARNQVERLRQRALDLPFASVGDIIELNGAGCEFEDRDGDDPLRWLLIQACADVERKMRGGDSCYYMVAPKHVIAFEAYPGDGCEPANFGLCRYSSYIEIEDRSGWQIRKRRLRTGLTGWRWHSFCKTQYASNPRFGGVENFLRCHLAVIKMLDFAESLGLVSSVSDEGKFWTQRDVTALAKEIGEWNEMMAGFVGRINDWMGEKGEAEITKFPNYEHLEAKGRREEV